MSEQRKENVYDKLDILESGQREIGADIKELKEKLDAGINQKLVVSQQPGFNSKRFILSSKQTYHWFGPIPEFEKKKKITIILLIIFIIINIITTVVVSIAAGLYTTFSFFENIWMIFAALLLSYSLKAEKNYDSFEYVEKCMDRHIETDDGILLTIGNKRRYKLFLILALLSSVGNIIATASRVTTFVFVIILILELLTMIFIVISFISVKDLFEWYMLITFVGINDVNKEKIVLAFDLAREIWINQKQLKIMLLDTPLEDIL